jgi:hypothetical protein
MHVDPYTPHILFVRECYEAFFNTIERLKLKGKHVALITGTPGTGKTMLANYMGYLLTLNKKQVVFDLLDNKFCIVRSNGTWEWGKRGDNFAKELEDPTTYYLFDGRASVKDGPLSVKAFTVVTSSPNRDHFTKDYINRNPHRLYMPIWTLEELEICRQHLFPSVAKESMLRVYSYFGGVPRWTLHALALGPEPAEVDQNSDDAHMKTQEECALESFNEAILGMNFERVQNFIGQGNIFNDKENSIVHKVMHIIPSSPKFDCCVLQFASPTACEIVLAKLNENVMVNGIMCSIFLRNLTLKLFFVG